MRPSRVRKVSEGQRPDVGYSWCSPKALSKSTGQHNCYRFTLITRRKCLEEGHLSRLFLEELAQFAPGDQFNSLIFEQLAEGIAGEEVEIALSPGSAPVRMIESGA